MKCSPEELVKFKTKIQQQIGPNVVITSHFMERLAERSSSLAEFATLLAITRDILKDKMCVIAYQSVLNNGVTRVKLTTDFKMVCYCNVAAMKLVVKTVY